MIKSYSIPNSSYSILERQDSFFMVLYSCEGVVCRYRTGDVREVKMGGIIFIIDQMILTCDRMSALFSDEEIGNNREFNSMMYTWERYLILNS